MGIDSFDMEVVDEIKQFYDCRYLSACEATWRIFGYDVHYRTPAVVRLPFHFPNQQQIVYDADDDIEQVMESKSVATSKFQSWMECNKIYPQARELTYVQFPTQFVWILADRCWRPRKEKKFAIGRIHTISPSQGEAYFLRILLNKVKGPTSFEEIRTVNGETQNTFRDACFALGILDDDKEFIDAIDEANNEATGYELRSLFGTMLMSVTLSRPDFVWEKTWPVLADGILHIQRRLLQNPDLTLTEDQLKILTLAEIESFLLRNNSTLKNFPEMPYPNGDVVDNFSNRLIVEELQYEKESCQKEFDDLFPKLTDEQHCVYNEIVNAVQKNKGGLFFVYGYGGTGKTFLWRTLSSYLRAKGEIVLNVASSGIAYLLLTGGRTAHSRFHIPLVVTKDSLCYIKPDSDATELLKQTKLIIWDEAPMTKKTCI